MHVQNVVPFPALDLPTDPYPNVVIISIKSCFKMVLTPPDACRAQGLPWRRFNLR